MSMDPSRANGVTVGAASALAGRGQMLPLAVAVSFGPAIDVAQWWASQAGMESASQTARGALLLLMAISVGLVSALQGTTGFIAPIAALAAYGFAWNVLTGDIAEGLIFFVRLCFLALVYVSAEHFARAGALTKTWILRGAWVALSALLASQLTGRALGVTSVYRSEFDFPGLTGRPAVAAASAVALLPFFFLRSRWRVSDALGVALLLASILGTQRRSALLAIAVGFFAYALSACASGLRWATVRTALILLTFGLILAAVATRTPLGNDLSRRLADLNFVDGGTGSGRTAFVRLALEHVRDRDAAPTVLGEGLGAVRKRLGYEFGHAIGAHNDWLDLLYAFGIIGAALFLWFHVRLILLARMLPAHTSAAVWMAVGSIIAIEFTAGGVLDPTFAPAFALFGFVAGKPACGRDRLVQRPAGDEASDLRSSGRGFSGR